MAAEEDGLKPAKVLFPDAGAAGAVDPPPLAEPHPAPATVSFGAHAKYRLHPERYAHTLDPLQYISEPRWREGHRDRRRLVEAVILEAERVAVFERAVSSVMASRPAAAGAGPTAVVGAAVSSAESVFFSC